MGAILHDFLFLLNDFLNFRSPSSNAISTTFYCNCYNNVRHSRLDSAPPPPPPPTHTQTHTYVHSHADTLSLCNGYVHVCLSVSQCISIAFLSPLLSLPFSHSLPLSLSPLAVLSEFHQLLKREGKSCLATRKVEPEIARGHG